MSRPRFPIPALLLLLACTGDADEPPPERSAAASSTARARALVEPPLRETLRRSERSAVRIEDALRPLPLLRPGEEAALRRFPNADHVARARALGVRAENEEALGRLVEEGRLVQLEDSTRHWIVREGGGSPAHVVPHTRELLREMAERFQARLEEMGIPPYRLEVTSALRTSDRQAALRRTNVNAAAGTSAHEFGTTVDVAYSAYAPPEEIPAGLVPAAPDWLRPHLRRIAAVTLESVSARKSRELKAVLGQVLREMQDEGLVLVTLERLQPVYHVTVAAPLAGG